MPNRDSAFTKLTKSMVLGATVLGILFFCARAVGLQQRPQAKPTGEIQLSLAISVPKNSYEAGSTIPLRIELQNKSLREICLGFSFEETSGMPDNMSLSIEDSSGRKVSRYDLSIHESRPGEWWVRLQPGYFYGREVEFFPEFSSFVKRPGKYKIRAIYAGLKPSEDALVKPPMAISDVFTGTVQSDTVTVEIVPRP